MRKMSAKPQLRNMILIQNAGTCLAVQWLRLHLPMQGAQVQSLVGEVRSHMPHSQKIKHKTETVL